MASIIQWNCRGHRGNFEELQKLVSDHKAVAICLPETYLKDNENTTIKGFCAYHRVCEGERASGGSSILI